MITDTTLSHVHMLSSRVDRAFYSRVEARFDITLVEWRVILSLIHEPGITAMAIADRWGMDKMAVSRAVRRLEQMDRIERRRNPRDRRSHVLSVTGPGRALHRRILPGATARHREILACLDPDEVGQLRQLLTRLIAHIDELDRSTGRAPTNRSDDRCG